MSHLVNTPQQPVSPADWETGFELRHTEAQLPYKEYTGALDLAPTDRRRYRLVRLPNNLTVVCVEDSSSAHAAAALTVNIGSLSDPPEHPGLAHFLEHMLLRGSKRYPRENELSDYVATHAGEYNAATAATDTVYYFHLDNAALEGALDRLACLLVEPLMDAGCTERELNAVHSEFVGGRQDDMRRAHVALCTLANPAHGIARFSVGNRDTLRSEPPKDIREELLRFFHAHYSADLMKLVVVANHPVDTLVEWTVNMFSPVKSKGDTRPDLPFHPLGPDELGRVLRYESLGNNHCVSLVFAIPEIKSSYFADPYGYIISLLDRKDSGSLF
ncbi:metalloprotease, partial [Coemansia sp. RSA 2607]